MPGPRVAILGVILESNRQSAVATKAEFESFYVLEGDAVIEAARAETSVIAPEASTFVKTMDVTGEWEPVPVLLAACHPLGPIDQALHEEYLGKIRAGLEAAGQLDAVYIANHGAMVATESQDPDGDIIMAARDIIGPDVPIVVTLDLHANISDEMVAGSDLIVGYRTNPHVDMIERGEEAALSMRLILAGRAAPQMCVVRLPMTPASVALLSAQEPYGSMIDLGQRRKAEEESRILNVSVFGGFVYSDTSYNGVAVVVTARNDMAEAKKIANEIAQFGWENREKFMRQLTSIEDGVAMAMDHERLPVIYADAGDNPGGGGTGRSTDLLKALVDADAQNVLYGSYCDPPLAKAAHAAGMGGAFTAEFNTLPGTPSHYPLTYEAEVVGLHDGNVVGRLGLLAGRQMHLGPSAAIRIGGITVVVISDRTQTADPMFFEMFGLDIGEAQTVVVKSRGHFRAGFIPWFPPERVYEIDTDGLVSPILHRRQWQYLPRPVFPLDDDVTWEPKEA